MPFDLEKPDTSAIEKILSSSSVPISLSTVFNKATPEGVAGLQWALKQGRPVDIDVRVVLSNSALEGFEDMILKARVDVDPVPPVILCLYPLISYVFIHSYFSFSQCASSAP